MRRVDTDLLIGGRASSARTLESSLHYRPYNIDVLLSDNVRDQSLRGGVPYSANLGVPADEHRANLEGLEERLERHRSGRASNGGIVEQVVHLPALSALADWLRDEGIPNITKIAKAGGRTQLLCQDTIEYEDNKKPFNRTASPESGHGLLRYGWPQGRERLAGVMYEFDKQFKREVQRAQWLPNTSGMEVNVAAFVEGDPEHMIDYRPGQDRAKAVTITVDVNVRCDACGLRPHDAEPTPPGWLLQRGVAVTMLVRQLMAAGYQVTLRTVTHTLYPSHFNNGGKFNNYPRAEGFAARTGMTDSSDFMRTVVVDVLTPGRTVDLDNVVFALAHEDYIRRFDFLLHEALNYGPPFNWTVQTPGVDRSSWAIGTLPLHSSHALPIISSVDTRADIYLPSAAVTRDISRWSNGKGHLQHVELLKRLLGDGFAADHNDFSSTEKAVMWTLRALEGLGVKFV